MIGSLVSSSMRLRSLVVVLAAILMVIGFRRLDDMPVDIFPEILPVTVNVQTEALGLSAAEVEQLITVPIEADLLAGTPWVDVMRSESVPGLSSIELQFKPGTDPMDARQVVQEKLTQAHALPNVSRPPQMLQPLSSTNRIMIIGLSSKTRSLIDMSVLARWTIRPRLMGVPGVANVSIWGQRERQLQVQVDPARLAEKRISLLDIVKTTGNSLWYSPLTFLEASVAGTGGFIETPNQRLGVRHVLPITTAAELARVPVEGTTTPLHQVATVVEDHQPLIGDAMNAGGPGLMLVVEKLPGVNTLEVSDDILEALEALKPGLGGIEIDPTIYRPAGYIRTSIGTVERALLVGMVLVILSLLVLSHGWRAALIGLVTIPVSLMVAVLLAERAGATMNIMVIAGLVAALGVIVHEAILSAHAMVRRLREGPGASISRTLFEALSEVRGPMIFATAVIVVMALPAMLMAGPAGALVKPLVMTYGLAVIAALLVALTLTPALGLLLFQGSQLIRHESAFSGWVKRTADGLPPGIARAAAAFVVLAGVVGLVLLPRLGASTAPSFKEPDLLVQWDAAPGTSRAAMNRLIDRVSQELRTIPGVRNVGAHIGRAIQSDQVVGIHSSEMWVNVDPRADYDQTVAAVEEVVAGYPGIDGDVVTFLRSRFGEALSKVDEPIVVRMYGQRPDVLKREAEKLRQSLASVPGIVDSRLELEDQEPVVEIEVDLAAAERYGIKPGEVRRAAATLLSGLEVGNLFEEQKIFEVVVWGVPEVRHSIASIRDMLIDTPAGGHVRLGDVASVRIVPMTNVIHRENVARTLDVVAGVKGRSVEAVSADVRRRIRETSFPLEYRAELLGTYASERAAMNRVALAGVGALIAIVFILHAAFGSWPLACAVTLTLPLAAGGGILAAATLGTVPAAAVIGGLLTALSLAVRFSTMLIGGFGQLRTRGGMAFGPDLVRHGVREWTAPILVTGLVSVAAVVPFAIFGTGPGLEVLGPLAIVMLGGLVTAILYAVCVVPVLYARLGAGAVPDAVEEENLSVAV